MSPNRFLAAAVVLSLAAGCSASDGDAAPSTTEASSPSDDSPETTQATSAAGSPGCEAETPGWSDDQQFVTDLLDDVGSTACIDTDRVLATGFAVGAVFAAITACNQADRIAVLATVSGLYDPEGCDPATPVPVISFHGTGDRFIPFDGSIGSGPAGLGLSPETTSGLVFMAGRRSDRRGCGCRSLR